MPEGKSAEEKPEAGTVGRPIDNAGVGRTVADLGERPGNGCITISIQFVLPTNNPGSWKKAAQKGKHLRCGLQHQLKAFGGTRNLLHSRRARDLEVAKSGRVEKTIPRPGFPPEDLFEGLVRAEWLDSHSRRCRKSCPFSPQAEHLGSNGPQSRAEKTSELAGGHIGDPPHLVDQSVGGAACHDGPHCGGSSAVCMVG